MPKPAKAPAVVFVTKNPTPSATGIPSREFKENFAKLEEPDLLFPPPAYRPIETPKEFTDSEDQRNRFRCAAHEIGHGLACMFVCREMQALTITTLNGSTRGSAFSSDSHGEDGAIVDLGGICAEQLVVGSGDCDRGAATDIRQARQRLRDEGTSESLIEPILQSIHRELQLTFKRDWLPAIKLAAIKLTHVGVLDWEGFIELVAMAQRNSYLADPLRKSLDSIKAGIGTLHKTTNPFELLVKSLRTVARDTDRHKAQVLDNAASLKGLTAHEIAKLETLRNHADTRAQEHARGK